MTDLIYNLTIFAGGNYTVDFSYVDNNGDTVGMTGWTVEATLREFNESSSGTDFLCTSDEHGVHLALSAMQTRSIGYSQGVYDVFVTSPDKGVRIKLVRGRADIIAEGAR